MKLPGDNYHMDNSGKKLIGAVLVQGGGIAGIQAALDLADSGFKVYLVERDAAIGGMMAHLDKTFPTGDCATCIVSLTRHSPPATALPVLSRLNWLNVPAILILRYSPFPNSLGWKENQVILLQKSRSLPAMLMKPNAMPAVSVRMPVR